MKSFEFQKHSCEVDISGHTFEMDCSSAMGDMIQTLGGEFTRAAEDYRSGKINTDDALELYIDSIDKILCPGAAAQIFEGRTATIDDAVDVMLYLMEALREYTENRTKARVGSSTSTKHGKKK